MRTLAIRYGIIFGILFSLVGVLFVAFSILTDVSRPLWLGLNQIKSVVGFGLCGLAGCLVGRRTDSVRLAALAGMVAGAMGGGAVTAASYIVSYGFIEQVRQYPFEHYSYLNSGAANIREYLLSERGRITVTETSLGVMPIVALIAAVLGGSVGALGGWIGRRRLVKRLLLATPFVLVTLMVFGLWSDARKFATSLPTSLSPVAGTSFSGSNLPPGSTRSDTKGVEQVWVPAGCFRRGADPKKDADVNWYETPEHDVCITQGFWLDKYEVTNAAYHKFVEAGGYERREYWSEAGWLWKGRRRASDPVPPEFSEPQQPRVWVSWYEAEAYASWRGAQLPTEAQWEYAARGPESNRFPWGKDWDSERANTSELLLRKTVDVTRHENGKSWCGAFNLAGNAWEWTTDWYDSHLYRQAVRDDPQGPKNPTERVMERVLRGGSWGGPASSARSARRAKDIPSYRSTTLGIRLVSNSVAKN